MWTLLDRIRSYGPLLFLLVLSFSAKSQQNPRYSLYLVNSYLYNPAVGGIERFVDVRLGHRSQWTGIEGAPTTSYFSIHAPLNSKKLNTNSVSVSKKSYNNREDHTSSSVRRHHSIGALVLNDRSGSFNRYQANVSYSYHLPITKSYTLSFGVNVGILTQNLDLGSVRLSNPDDPLLTSSENFISQPDLGLGLWLYSSKFFLGASASRLVQSNRSFINSVEQPTTSNLFSPNYFLITGYRFNTYYDKLQFIPSVLVRYTENDPLAVEGGAKVVYNQRYWGGAVARSDESFSFFLGLAVSSSFDLSYSFDYGFTQNISAFSNGSHEVVIGIRLNNKAKVLCPQNQL